MSLGGSGQSSPTLPSQLVIQARMCHVSRQYMGGMRNLSTYKPTLWSRALSMGSALVVRKSFAILECLELDWTVPLGRVEHRPSFSMLTNCAYFVDTNPFAVEFNTRIGFQDEYSL